MSTIKSFRTSDWIVLGAIAVSGLLGIVHIGFGLRAFFAAFTSQAAAAWVQAIGAIAAIGIAIWIARSADRSAQLNARKAAKHFIRMAEAAIGGLYVVSDSQDGEGDIQKVRFLGELKEVQHIGRDIAIAQLSPELCDCVLDVRRMVARAYDVGSDLRHRRPGPKTQANHFGPRDGHMIGVMLLKASWEDMKEIQKKACTL